MSRSRRPIIALVAVVGLLLTTGAGPTPRAGAQGWADGWAFLVSGGAAVTFSSDRETRHSGQAALKITDASPLGPHVYGTVWQSVAVQPNTTYEFGAWIKAQDTNATQFTVTGDWAERFDAPDGTYDWRHFTFAHTTGANETALHFRLIVQDVTTAFWLDDVSMTVQGQTANLLANTGFEPGAGEEQTLRRFDAVEAKQPALKALLDKAKQRRLAVDYATVKYATVRTFLRYGRDDVANGQGQRAEYIVGELERLQREATDTLTAYLAGTAKPVDVPRYVTGDERIGIDGRSFVGTTRTTAGKVERDRPIFLNGYGHFDEVERDIPVFKDHGVNAAQIEIGPDTTIFPADTPGYQPSTTDPAKVTFARDTGTKRGGKAALAVRNTGASGTLTQTLIVTPGREYDVALWVKATDAAGLTLTAGAPAPTRVRLADGTYDWTRVTFSFAAGPNTNRVGLALRTEQPITAAWIDDLSVAERGTTRNLAANPGFERAAPGKAFSIDTTILERRVEKALQDAERHDIAVNVLLSPHYMPAFAFAKWPHIRIPNGGFLTYDVNDPGVRSILRAHLETVIRRIGHYPSLQSVVLTNEPVYIDHTTSANTKRLWHAYLRRTHQTVEKLNATWRTRHASFEAVPPVGWKVEATPAYYDWVRFNEGMFAGWHRWLADQVHAVRADLPVHAKIMPFPGWDRNLLAYGVDPERFGELSQISGDDNYGVLDWGTDGYALGNAFYDLQASMADKPIYNSEEHVILDGTTDYSPAQAASTRMVLWNGAIHGRNGSTMWVWSTMFNMMLVRPDVVAEVGRVSLDLNRLAREVTAFQNAKPRAGILASTASNVYTAGGEHLAARNTAYRALIYNGQKAGFVSERQAAAGKLGAYDLVILPRSTHVSAATLSALAAYAKKGGRIVVVGDDAVARDEYDRPSDSAVRQAALDGAVRVPANAPFPTLRETLLTELRRLGVARVVLVDTATGKPVDSVDYQSVRTSRGWLVSVASYDRAAGRQLRVELDGEPVTELVTDLLTGSRVGGADPIALPPLGTLLLELPRR